MQCIILRNGRSSSDKISIPATEFTSNLGEFERFETAEHELLTQLQNSEAMGGQPYVSSSFKSHVEGEEVSS
jgi:hypothetical protein